MINNIYKTKETEEVLVSLSDSIIEKIGKTEDELIFYFLQYGFGIKKENGIFERIPNTLVDMCKVNFEDSNIVCLSKCNFTDRIFYEKLYVSFDELVEKVNSREWKLEIIQEYNYDIGSFYSCRLSAGNNRVDCYIRIEHKTKVYRHL